MDKANLIRFARIGVAVVVTGFAGAKAIEMFQGDVAQITVVVLCGLVAIFLSKE